MKIFGVGKNYFPKDATPEDRASRPAEPVIFLKADSSYLHNGKPFFLPEFMGRIDYEVEIVARISKMGKNIEQRFARRYYDTITVGIDFTAKDMLNKLREGKNPWDIAKGFDGASVIGFWVEMDRYPSIDDIHFNLDINGEHRQVGCTADMIFSLHEVIAYVSQFFTLRTGDLIFSGTPIGGTGATLINDHFEGYIEGEKLLDFKCK